MRRFATKRKNVQYRGLDMDYKQYHFEKREYAKIVLISMAMSGIIAFLFYRSILGMCCFPFLLVLFYMHEKRIKKEKRSQKLLEEFVNGICVLNTALQAGISMENAWKEVQKELHVMYGDSSLFLKEVKDINHSVALNVPIERLMLQFAYRSGLEDIIIFAELFEYGKRSGGNWKRMIGEVVQHIQDKYDAKKEIEVMIASKKLEQQVLNIIPLGILFFLQISSWDYMNVLYHNPAGILCMSICLFGYGGAILLSEKLLQIQV